MIKRSIFTLILALICSLSFSQHWVYFKDKGKGVSSENIDAPIQQKYKSRLEKTESIELIGYSKWLNAACVNGDISTLNNKRYVSKIEPVTKYKVSREFESIDSSLYGAADIQLNMLGLDRYHEMGYTGEGITIGVFDAGFKNLKSFIPFDSMWIRGQIKASYDFVRRGSMEFNTSMHGTSVLSIMGIDYPDSLIGAAPHANFVLARTEDANSETHIEEYNWIKALEWADSVGVDIIHSSLGYSQFDSGHYSYTYEDMDGGTSLITLATDIAARKGIFVTNSAGNEGAKEWKFITAPCDGKHVLCVGAVDSFENIANFSSVGPSSDGRVKPEVVAMGHNTAHISWGGLLRFGSGTSFSGPLIAGMVACLMQAHPKATNEQIFEAIILSADRYQNPDSAYGYGLPNVMRADTILGAIVLGIDRQIADNKILVYPNPTQSEVKVTSKTPISMVRLVDLQGREIFTEKVYNKNEVELDVLELKAGTYVIELMTQGHRFSKRLAIVH